MMDLLASSRAPHRTMYPGRMRTTDPEATAAKQKWSVEARAAARKALMQAMTIL